MFDLLEPYGVTKFQVSSIILILFILLTMYRPKKEKNIKIDECPPKKINEAVLDIIKKKETDVNEKLWLSCKDGIIKGCVTGCLTGGFHGAIASGALFGVVNPILTYINETS